MPIPQFHRSKRTEDSQNNKKYYISSGNQHGKNKKTKLASLFDSRLYKILGVVFLLLIGYLIYLSSGLPDPGKLMNREVAQSTKIYDRTGKTILYEIHGEQKRTLVPLNDIPQNVRNATIAIEDKDFYNHGGFSVWAIFRTAVTDILFRKSAGASTLTQQFIKNAILTNEKTFTRKIKELILAYRLEKKFSKDEILQMYLNEIPYGSTAYGVEAASQKYFGKPIKNTNLAEAAILAALPQAPSRYSPYGPNKDILIARQHYILDQMVKQNYISQDEADKAKKIELAFKAPSDNILAPHFVMYIKELLSDKYGEKTVEQGGLKIITSLDLDKQKAAEEAIKNRAENNAKKYQASNASLVSIDPKTGQILAMVGSKDYFDEKIDGQVNIALSPRQPGSSFKPIVYSASFIKGYTPDTILYDVVTNFSTDPNNKYEPHNYDGAEHGPVTIRKALAGSLNIPAVKTIYLTGIDSVINLAKNMGYTTLKDKDRYGLSLVLGGGEVSLLEHTNAFSAFAQDGEINKVNPIIKIEDRDGKTLEEYKKENNKVFDAQIARQTTSILSDNNARAYVFGSRNFLTLNDRPVAAKTGTTNDYKDAWTIGYTPSIVTGVWVGNNNNTSMKRGADGSVVAAPIWHDYMQKVLSGTPVENFKSPETVRTGKAVLDGSASSTEIIKIDKASGLLATEYTPESYIQEINYGQPHDILYYVNKDDPRGPAPKNPSSDPQYPLWEAPVQIWAKKRGLISTTTLPTQKDNIHTPENRPTFTISEPINNQSIVNSMFSVKLSATAPRGIGRVEYYIDNKLLSTVSSYPFELEKNIDFLDNGYHDLTVKVYDDIDNSSEQKISFTLALSETKAVAPVEINWLDPNKNSIPINNDLSKYLNIYSVNYDSIAKINLYYQVNNSKPKLLSTVNSPNSTNIAFSIQKKLPLGVYNFYAEAEPWRGENIKTDTKTITIKTSTSTAD